MGVNWRNGNVGYKNTYALEWGNVLGVLEADTRNRFGWSGQIVLHILGLRLMASVYLSIALGKLPA